MAALFSKKLHENENASVLYDVVMLAAIKHIQSSIEHLSTSRKADEYVPGAIHALRKLCEDERYSGLHLCTGEVEEWRDCFFKWFERVKTRIPNKLRAGFRKNAEEDFQIILGSSEECPEFLWREKANQRMLGISLDKETMERAVKAAEQKHPVELGHALSVFLKRCIRDLLGDVDVPSSRSDRKESEHSPLMGTVAPRLVDLGDGRYSLSVSDFEAFGTLEDIEQDMVVNGYSLQSAIKRYLKKKKRAFAKDLKFGSESSMFSVTSSNLAALARVSEILFRFVTDEKLRTTYIHYEDG